MEDVSHEANLYLRDTCGRSPGQLQRSQQQRDLLLWRGLVDGRRLRRLPVVRGRDGTVGHLLEFFGI